MDELCCTIWPNNGDVWGIRLGAQREHVRGQENLVIDLAGERHTFELGRTFWTTCPEVRGAVIRDWLHAHGVTHATRRDFAVMLRRRGDHWAASVQPAITDTPSG